MSKRIGDVGPTVLAEQAENRVAQGGEGMCGVSRMGLSSIFAHGTVPDTMDAVLNGPMATPELLETGGAHIGEAQAGDPIGGLGADLFCLEDNALVLAAHDLADTRPVKVV